MRAVIDTMAPIPQSNVIEVHAILPAGLVGRYPDIDTARADARFDGIVWISFVEDVWLGRDPNGDLGFDYLAYPVATSPSA